jgi:photosystem II stability/assembly factor-like uncharacterized protein
MCIATAQTHGYRGAILESEDGGSTWVLVATRDNTTGLSHIACADASTCVIPDVVIFGDRTDRVYLTGGFGEEWTERSLPDGAALAYVDCLPERCIGAAVQADDWTVVTSGDGVTWSNGGQQPSRRPHYTRITCEGNGDCWLIGEATTGEGLVFLSTDGGNTWLDRTPSDDFFSAGDSACITPTRCWLGGVSLMLSTADGGASWAPDTLPPVDSVYLVEELGCVEGERCFAATDEGVLTTDGRVAWEFDPDLPKGSDLHHVECEGLLCVVTGGSDDGVPIVFAGSDRQSSN